MSRLPSGIIKKAIEERGYCHVKVSGSSMLPTYKAGETVKIIASNQVGVNDVVLFNYMDKMILHRVVMKNGNQMITRGDNNIFLDGEVSFDNIIGKTEKPANYYKQSDRLLFDRVIFQFWEIEPSDLSAESRALLEKFEIEARFDNQMPIEEGAIHVAIVQNAFSPVMSLDDIVENRLKRDSLLVVHFNVNCAQDERFEGQLISNFSQVVRLGTLDTCLGLDLSEQIQLFMGYLLGKCEVKR